MSTIDFNFKEGISDTDKANAMLTLIVNRALAFNRDNYDYVFCPLKNDATSMVAYQVLNMISTFKSIPVFISKIEKGRYKYYNKHSAARFFKFWHKLKYKKKHKLLLAALPMEEEDNITNIPNIFQDFDRQDIELIAKELYGWS